MFGFDKNDRANQLKAEPEHLPREKQEKILKEVEKILSVPREKKEAPSKPGEVTKDTSIAEAAKSSPHATEILLSYGLHCIGCGMNGLETIEQGCSGHGMEDEEIQTLVDELNEAAEDFEKEIRAGL